MKKRSHPKGEARLPRKNTTDLVRLYLHEISRVDLLSSEDEVILARQIQRRKVLLKQETELATQNNAIKDLKHLQELQQREAQHFCHWPTKIEWSRAAEISISELEDKVTKGYKAWGDISGLEPKTLKKALRDGRRAKDQMMQANLRLVVAVAKKYQKRGIELLDLVQEGTLGLEKAVDKFDPTRGFRFSTYAYWWIRQGITRAIATQSRTIRLPVHINEKLTRIKKVQQEIASQQGHLASISDLAKAMKLSEETIRETMMRMPKSISLETPVGPNKDSRIIDLLEDDNKTPEELLTLNQLHHDLEALLQGLNSREATIIRKRFGLDDDLPQTLTQIGADMHLSRERIRQLETRALLKLQQPERRCKINDYIQNLDS